MKVLNEIKAEKSGVITEIMVENATPVEFGQPLFVIA
jgi:acetyl-CoA carboxylase biotin carboxyl carrier protein